MMDNKTKVVYLIHRDVTYKNRYTCEIDWINRYADKHPELHIIPVCIGKKLSNFIKKRESYASHRIYDNVVYMVNDLDLSFFDDADIMITSPLPQSIIGGILKKGWVNSYVICSYFTNELNKPLWISLGDSEMKLFDVRDEVEKRHNGNPNEIMNTDPNNIKWKKVLLSVNRINYNNVYWAANGNKKMFDWVTETIVHRCKDKIPKQTEEVCRKNTIYITDDIYNGVTQEYDRLSKFDNTQYTKNKLCYFGFFNQFNHRRVTVLNKLFNDLDNYNIPIDVIGLGSTSLKQKQSLATSEQEFDGDEMYETLNKYVAMINIGKGNNSIRYIGKTVYDGIVSRIPILMYHHCDVEHRLFPNNPEYYFNDIDELNQKYQLLLNNEIRQTWINNQKNIIFTMI